MIKKERNIPLKLRKLTALSRRLPSNHPKRPEIEKELAKQQAGYNGEQSLDYYLSFLPNEDYFILHDLRLPHKDYFFQIDTLLLSPFFALILEVKNIAGIIYFDETFHQLIRTIDNKEEGFPDPVTQVEHQQAQLKYWFNKHKFPPLPIETLVVISRHSTVIKGSKSNPKRLKKVIHSPDLQHNIKQFTHTYKNERIPIKELRRMANQLNKKHTPPDPDIFEQFSIKKEEVLTGVHCPECYALPMGRWRGSWLCRSCWTTSKSAHLEALKDYALLIDSEITNQQLRAFLQLSSSSVARKILTSMNLEHSGTTKGRKYRLTFDDHL